jgi:hypothetical protein
VKWAKTKGERNAHVGIKPLDIYKVAYTLPSAISDSYGIFALLVSPSMRMTRGDGIVSVTRLSILALGALSDRMLPIWEDDKAKNNRFVFGEQIIIQLGNTAPKVSSLWSSGWARPPLAHEESVLHPTNPSLRRF